jgi:hypothetical protein
MGWFKFDTLGITANALAFGDATGPSYVQFGSNTSDVLFIWDGTDTVTGASAQLGIWQHLALVIQSPVGTPDNALGYVNGVLNITNPAISDGVSAEKLWVGNDNDAEALQGNAAAIKIWSGVELTAAEIANEMRQYLPHRTANLYGFWPLLSIADDEIDFSGNANTWTVTGVPITVKGPPIPWREGRRRVRRILAAAAATPRGWDPGQLYLPPPRVEIVAY